MTAFQLLLQNLRDDAQDLRAMAAIEASVAGEGPLHDLAEGIALQADALERTMMGRVERSPACRTAMDPHPAA